MNFIFITFDFPPTVGGIQTRAKNYVQNLVRMKNKILVIHLLDPEVLRVHYGKMAPFDDTFSEKYLGATINRFPSSISGLFKIFFKTTGAVRNIKADVIHLISGANTPIGLLFLIYGKTKGIKTGISFYGKDLLDSHHIYLLLSRLAMLLADTIGVNSGATSQLIPYVFRRKVVILYPGVDIDILRRIKLWKTTNRKKKILFVGRLVKRKAADDLLRAFKLVIEKIPKAHLVIVGDGPQREALSSLTQKLKIQKWVEFTGTLYGNELYKRYQECDVFVMPSKETKGDMEGFGMVFLEAGLFKKPSIGTWSGGIPEAIVHNETGILVPQGSVKALAEAIMLLLNDEILAKRLGENAHNRVIENFSWEKATLDFLNMYLARS